MKKIFFCLVAVTLIFGCATPKKDVLDEAIFYPPLPNQPRLQYLMSISNEDDLKGGQSSFEEFLVGKQTSEKDIGRPYAFGSVKGKIYVVDREYKSIIVLDLENAEFDFVKAKGLGTIYDPGGIWVTEDNYKYVADFGRQQILVFDKEEKFVRSYGEPGQLDRPLDVAVYESNIYVCDFDKHQIVVFDKESGEIINTIGTAGQEDGEFLKPTHITIGQWGDLYVMDAFNFRVQKFDAGGQYISTIGGHGDGPGAFARPKGISVDQEANLYAVDIAFENVQIFDDKTGKLLLYFGGYGNSPGNMYLPTGIHIYYENVDYFKKYADKNFRIKYVLYVANSLGRAKVNVYAFGEWIGPPLPEMK